MDDVRVVLAELPIEEWSLLQRLADEDDRGISQMATRLLRRALRELLAERQGVPQCS